MTYNEELREKLEIIIATHHGIVSSSEIDEILSLIRKALPKKDDDRPEIRKWIISKDYTQGKNDVLSDITRLLGGD